jgi:hypothetical protein
MSTHFAPRVKKNAITDFTLAAKRAHFWVVKRAVGVPAPSSAHVAPTRFPVKKLKTQVWGQGVPNACEAQLVFTTTMCRRKHAVFVNLFPAVFRFNKVCKGSGGSQGTRGAELAALALKRNVVFTA